MKVQICAVALLALFAVAQALTECPDINGEKAESVPNPYDCTTFYKCESGIYVLTPCPPGLEYHEELGVCDWPEVSQCVAIVTTPAE